MRKRNCRYASCNDLLAAPSLRFKGFNARPGHDTKVLIVVTVRRFHTARVGTGHRIGPLVLVQATCERVLSRLSQSRHYARLDVRVYSMMRNTWIDEVRSRRVRSHDDLAATSDVVGHDGGAVAEGRITLGKVRRALAQLSEEQRSVLVLMCVDGLAYKEAAAVLDIPVGTVMSRLSRARQELHARLSDRRATNFVGAS